MTSPAYRLRSGTIQGVKHIQHGTNNQDAVLYQEFSIPKRGKNYRIGLASDGCSGIPAFTHSEVGSNLLVVFCLAHIQELIVGGAKMAEIPLPLYHAVINFLRNLASTVMPSNIHWPLIVKLKGANEFRNELNATQRFTTDYLAATIIGFVDDGEDLVTFQAGDGVIIINDDIHIVDQNDRPAYPAIGGGFDTANYPSAEIQRIALATDGIEELLGLPNIGLPDRLFSHAPNNPMGLQYLLNLLRKEFGEYMGDDCGVIAMERIDGGTS